MKPAAQIRHDPQRSRPTGLGHAFTDSPAGSGTRAAGHGPTGQSAWGMVGRRSRAACGQIGAPGPGDVLRPRVADQEDGEGRGCGLHAVTLPASSARTSTRMSGRRLFMWKMTRPSLNADITQNLALSPHPSAPPTSDGVAREAPAESD